MSKSVIIFDFDGVIIDSFGFHLKNLQEMYVPDLTADEYRRAHTGSVFETPGKLAFMDWRSYYKKITNQVREKQLVPGMEDVLTRDVLGSQTAIVSSTSEVNICAFLEKNETGDLFDMILGVDASPSKVEKLKRVCEDFGVTIDEALFVTDTTGDVREAMEVDLDTVAVTWGYHGRESFEDLPVVGVVDTPEELRREIIKQKK